MANKVCWNQALYVVTTDLERTLDVPVSAGYLSNTYIPQSNRSCPADKWQPIERRLRLGDNGMPTVQDLLL